MTLTERYRAAERARGMIAACDRCGQRRSFRDFHACDDAPEWVRRAAERRLSTRVEYGR